MIKITWKEKYSLALKETLNTKEIMMLREVGQPKALKLRQLAIEYCIMNNIPIDGRKVPTEAVFKVTGLNLSYYYDKMLLEAKIDLLNRGVNYVSA